MVWGVGSRTGGMGPRLILSKAQKSAGAHTPCSASEWAGLQILRSVRKVSLLQPTQAVTHARPAISQTNAPAEVRAGRHNKRDLRVQSRIVSGGGLTGPPENPAGLVVWGKFCMAISGGCIRSFPESKAYFSVECLSRMAIFFFRELPCV